jgi:hypothetical protein
MLGSRVFIYMLLEERKAEGVGQSEMRVWVIGGEGLEV